ncbi:MAG: universal stress protein [Sphingobacteriaceae bacterium]|nr:universal stress protein [Sphingobacteriaceae bacterium]
MKTILVPTDFSNNANNALVFANSIAKKLNAKIILLYIYEPTISKSNPISGLIAEEIVSAKNNAEKKIKALASKYITVNYKSIIEVHDPVETILLASSKLKVDLIVMGTHGATGLKKVIFGSNTSNVIAKAKVPVLAIPQGYKSLKIDKIICTSDLWNIDKELKAISPIAKALGTVIEVIYLDFGWEKELKPAQHFNAAIKKLRNKKIYLTRIKSSVEDRMVDVIQRSVNKSKNALFTMFPEKLNFIERIFIGSKTEQIAKGLKMPLLSIRKENLKK